MTETTTIDVVEALRNATCDAAPYGWEPRTMGGYEITECARRPKKHQDGAYFWSGALNWCCTSRLMLWSANGVASYSHWSGSIFDLVPRKPDSDSTQEETVSKQIEEVRHLSNPAITYVPTQIILDGNGKIIEVVSGTIKLRQDGMLEGLNNGEWRKL